MIKKLFTFINAVLVALASITLSLTQAQVVKAAEPNLIPNASVEQSADGLIPDGWKKSKWGTNNGTFTYSKIGHTGARSLKVRTTTYTSGDAKWSFLPVQVQPNKEYIFSDWYKSTVATNVDIVITSTTGAVTYIKKGSVPASANWTQATFKFKTTQSAKTVTVNHYLNAIGEVYTDDFSLTAAPVPTAPTVAINNPVNNATVAGTQSISATASDAQGIASVQFKLDGVNFGAPDTVAPYAVDWNTNTVANGNHTLTAVAKNTANLVTTSVPVNVNVANAVTPPPAPTNLIANPSVENSTTGWMANSWGANTSSLTYENTGRTGSHSLKVTMTSRTDGDAKWYFNPISVTAGTNYSYSNWYKSNVDTEIDAMVTMGNGTVQYFYLKTVPASNDWAKTDVQFTAPVGAATITIFHVIATVGYLQTDDFSFAPYQPAMFNRALVSLTFDDGWRSIYSNGLPILNKYGMVSTQYLLTSTTDYPDYMTVEMMQAFKDQGSEIASHTVSHAHLPLLSLTDLRNELTQSQVSLREWFGLAGVANNFATPYGEYNTTVVNEVKTLYRSHRSTDTGYNSKDNFDIYNIKVQNILNTTTPEQVRVWVDQAIATKTWLVLVYHEVTDNAGSEDATWATTPALLDAQLNQVKQSGVTVKTVDQALNEIIPQL